MAKKRDYRAERQRRIERGLAQGKTLAEATGKGATRGKGKLKTVRGVDIFAATENNPQIWRVGKVPEGRTTRSGKYIPPELNYRGNTLTTYDLAKAISMTSKDSLYIRIAIYGKQEDTDPYGILTGGLLNWKAYHILRESALDIVSGQSPLGTLDRVQVAEALSGPQGFQTAWKEVLAFSVAESRPMPGDYYYQGR